MGELRFTSFEEADFSDRLHEWFGIQSGEQKPIYYLLPSVRWFQAARKMQPGISFQTFDDLAVLLLKAAQVEFTPINEQDRIMFFYEILNREKHFLSQMEISKKAKAYSDSYGQLKRLGLNVEETPLQLQGLKAAFYTYEQEYRDEKGFYDPENRIGKGIEAAAQISPFPLSHVVIDGYLDFSPVQYQLIQFLEKNSVPVTIYLPQLETPIITETIATLKRLGLHYNDEKLPPINALCQKPNVNSATTIEEELHGVLDTIATLKGTGQYHDFGIVLATENVYLQELTRLSEQKKIPIKKAKKKPLSETNIVSFLNLVLEEKKLESKWEQLPLVETLASLCFLSPNEFIKIKDAFIKTGQISQEEINTLLGQVMSFQATFPAEATMVQYAKNLSHFINGLSLFQIWKNIIQNKKNPRLLEVALEIRSLQRIKEILLRSIEEDGFPTADIIVHLDTFREKYLSRLDGEFLYLERMPTDGVEIYSFRDVALFKGKHLFVLGLNEGVFPKQHNLTGYFQERYLENYVSPFPLPLSDLFRKKDDAVFLQLKYLAENLTFSYVEGMNPNQPLLASKYIMDESALTSFSTISRLTNNTYQSDQEYTEKVSYHFGIGQELKHQPAILKEYIENLDYLQTGQEMVSSKWRDKLYSNRISITSLERYAACSFRFGLERLLKVKEPLEKQRRIDAIETGNMVHRIIERFYRDVKGIPFSELASFFKNKEAEETLSEIFTQEWETIVQLHTEIPFIKLRKAKEDWWKKLRRWLAAERVRFWYNESLAQMRIFRIEEPVQLTIELENNEILTLTGKIDRVDIDEHGFVIYDYKSSDKKLDFEKEIPAGVVLQIPLYMMALEHDFSHGKYQTEKIKNGTAIGGGYISMKDPHYRKHTVWRDEEQKNRFEHNGRIKPTIIPLNSEELKQNYKFHELVEGLWRGTQSDFSVKPFSKDTCKYCAFKPICRVTVEQQNS